MRTEQIGHDFQNLEMGPQELLPWPVFFSNPYEGYQKPTDSPKMSHNIPPELYEEITTKESTKNLLDHKVYLEYLYDLEKKHLEKFGKFAHKAKTQLECLKRNINDEQTRIIDPSDLGTLFTYVKSLIDQDRVVWIGSSTVDDMTDPQTDKKDLKHCVTPPLYKNGIRTIDDLYSVLPSINLFKDQHPDMLLKVFPQDKEKPTLTSIVFTNNDTDKKISLHFRPGKYTPKDRLEGNDHPIDIDIDLNGDIPLIYLEKVEDVKWLEIVLNSLDIFERADEIDFGSTPVVNIELMHLDAHPKLDFITDIIYGAGKDGEIYNKIRFVEHLKKIKEGIIVPKSSAFNPKEYISNPGQLTKQILSLLESNSSEIRRKRPGYNEVAGSLAGLKPVDKKILRRLSQHKLKKLDQLELRDRLYLNIEKYLPSADADIVKNYISTFNVLGYKKHPVGHDDLTHHIFETLRNALPIMDSNSNRLKLEQNSKMAKHILSLLKLLDMSNSEITIPTSILYTLNNIAHERRVHIPISKALLALKNRIEIQTKSRNGMSRLARKESQNWVTLEA